MEIQDPSRVRHALLVAELVACAATLLSLASAARPLLAGVEATAAIPALAWTIGCTLAAVAVGVVHGRVREGSSGAGALVLATGVSLVCVGLLPVMAFARTAAERADHGAAVLIGVFAMVAGVMTLVAQARPAVAAGKAGRAGSA
jgi:Zn-dependent protease with chaperone function